MIKLSFLLYSFSFCLNFLLIRILYKNAKFLRLVDIPDRRKTHNTPTPIILGLSMFLTFVITLFFFYDTLSLLSEMKEFMIFFSSIFFVFIIGIVDDSIGISTGKKLFIQLIISLFVILGLKLDQVMILPFSNFYYLNLISEIIFILGITNSINLIDGIDNLSSGISIIISISFICLLCFIGCFEISYILIIVLGCLFSNMVFNNFIGRVFLGDSGSLLLGWMFSLISLICIKLSNGLLSINIPLIILALPAMDVIYVMYFRFLKYDNTTVLIRIKNIFLPDRSHIHHSLLNYGFNSRKICFVLYSSSAFFAFIGIVAFIYLNNFYISIIIFLLFFLYFIFRNQLGKI